MSKNTEYIYSNQVVVGEDAGTPYMVGRNQKLNTETNIVAEDRTPVITYTDSTNTIDFHNKPVVNFTGGSGGGGGDTFLAGGTSLTTPQTFTGFNRMTNDTQFADGVLFSDDGTNINGKIHATASQLHIETNNVLDTISMKLAPAGSTNTLELKQDPDATTQNALFIQQVAGSSTLNKVLTNSSQDLGVIVDSVEASPNTFTNTNTFSTSTTTTGITNTGGLTNSNGMVNSGGITSDVLTVQGLLTTQSLNATQTITGTTLVSNGDITCNSGTNLLIGGTQISSGDLFDSSSIVKNTDTSLTIAGQIQGDTLISTNNITSLNGGAILAGGINAVGNIISTAGNVEARGGSLSLRSAGAGMIDDVSRNILIQANTDGNKIWFGLGGGANKALQLDKLGDKARLKLYDYTTGRDQYYDVGQNPDDITNLIALLNNTSLTFNPTTTLSAQGTLVHIGANALLCGGGSNGTLNIGVSSSTDIVNIEASVNFDGTNTHTFGTNSTVILSGTTTLASGTTDIGKSGVSYGVFGQLEFLTNKFATPSFVGVTYETSYQDVANRFPLGVFLETYGTNTKVTIRGCFEYKPGGVGTNIPVGKFATLPSGAIPTRPVIVSVQGQIGFEQGRVDIETNGNLIFQGASVSFGICNLSQISYFINV